LHFFQSLKTSCLSSCGTCGGMPWPVEHVHMSGFAKAAEVRMPEGSRMLVPTVHGIGCARRATGKRLVYVWRREPTRLAVATPQTEGWPKRAMMLANCLLRVSCGICRCTGLTLACSHAPFPGVTAEFTVKPDPYPRRSLPKKLCQATPHWS
jgi:hypothetical protein